MKNIQLLIVDPQNDFCDIPDGELPRTDGGVFRPALPVQGAHADMRRLAAFLDQASDRIRGITVTLDSHPYVAIERVTFWRDASGQAVAPFTMISAGEVEQGVYVPRFQRDLAIRQLRALETAGRQLVVWPVHCVTGTWGHNIHAGVADALAGWEQRHGKAARKVLKGEYPWSEHYGVFEAETPLPEAPGTWFNLPLARALAEDTDLLLVAGEASSHCVAASVDQLLAALADPAKNIRPGAGWRIALLTDCMSPVPGFEQAEREFLARAEAAGVILCTASEARALLDA